MSFAALAAVGLGICAASGACEVVRELRRIGGGPAEEPRGRAGRAAIALTLVLALAVGTCAVADRHLKSRKNKIFRRVAAEQLQTFGPRIAADIANLPNPPTESVPQRLFDAVKSLDNMDIIVKATLYIPDREDPAAMWGFTAWRGFYDKKDGFARFYVAKPFEQAMRKAVDGDENALQRQNEAKPFEWYGLVQSDEGKPLGVLRLDGNRWEKYEEYD